MCVNAFVCGMLLAWKANLPERSEGTQETEDSEDAEDAGWRGGEEGHEDINKGDDHQGPIHDIPARVKVCILSIDKTLGNDLSKHKGATCYNKFSFFSS